MTVEERGRLADELKALSAPALTDRLVDLLRAKLDPGQTDLAWRLLVSKLQSELDEPSKSQLYLQFESLMTGAELENPEKSQLIQILGRTATTDALSLLLKLGRQDSLTDLQPLVFKMISSIGDEQWDGRFHEELSPVLEQAWGASQKPPGLAEALAHALAGVGAPAGIEVLYAEARRGGETVSQFAAQEDNMSWHVFDVFRRIRNPDAVATLAARLGDQPLDDLSLVLSGTALASMGRIEATSALLRWAESSTRDVGEWLTPWLAEVRDPSSLSLLEQTIATPAVFRNPTNRNAVDRALREYHDRRTVTTSPSSE